MGVSEVIRRLNPNSTASIVARRRKDQLREVSSILRDADAIKNLFRSAGVGLPKVYNLFTVGFQNSSDARKIGEYGDKVFAGFAPPEIAGHAGTVAYSHLREMIFFNGRPHPNEWAGNEKGPMIVAHQLQVVKELARRQRARDGVDPLIILTYLVGVREGHALKPGGLALILDDTELTNIIHPGHGARAILDEKVGPHFQAKAGRSSHIEVAKAFANFAGENFYSNVYPAAACGAPGTSEYQSFLEVGLLDQAFETAREGNLGELAVKIFGEEGKANLSLLYDMGITSELATMRQTFPGEPDFKVLALGLATDSVGGKQSEEIDHGAVVAKALESGQHHINYVLRFARGFNTGLAQPKEDFSIQGR